MSRKRGGEGVHKTQKDTHTNIHRHLFHKIAVFRSIFFFGSVFFHLEKGRALSNKIAQTKRSRLLLLLYMSLMQEAKIYVDDSTITSHVKRIRKKFIAQDPEFDCIDTVYGMGYRWEPQAL